MHALGRRPALLEPLLAMATVGAVAIALFVRAGPVIGLRPVLIDGGSMRPAIPMGSLLLAATTPPDGIVVGDVITYRLPSGMVVTHRVRAVIGNPGERAFIVQGDANPTPDPMPVPGRALIGRELVALPFVGSLALVGGAPSTVLMLVGMLLIGSVRRIGRAAGAAAPDEPEGVP